MKAFQATYLFEVKTQEFPRTTEMFCMIKVMLQRDSGSEHVRLQITCETEKETVFLSSLPPMLEQCSFFSSPSFHVLQRASLIFRKLIFPDLSYKRKGETVQA